MNLAAKPSNYLDQQSPILWGWTALPDFRKGQSRGGIQSLGSRDGWFSLFTLVYSIKSQYFSRIPTCYHEKKKNQVTMFRKMLIFYVKPLARNHWNIFYIKLFGSLSL